MSSRTFIDSATRSRLDILCDRTVVDEDVGYAARDEEISIQRVEPHGLSQPAVTVDGERRESRTLCVLRTTLHPVRQLERGWHDCPRRVLGLSAHLAPASVESDFSLRQGDGGPQKLYSVTYEGLVRLDEGNGGPRVPILAPCLHHANNRDGHAQGQLIVNRPQVQSSSSWIKAPVIVESPRRTISTPRETAWPN
jgi:hypothetical protein